MLSGGGAHFILRGLRNSLLTFAGELDNLDVFFCHSCCYVTQYL